jgi:hypothetical protein
MLNIKKKGIIAILVFGFASIIILAKFSVEIIVKDGLWSDGGQILTGMTFVIFAIILFCWDIIVPFLGLIVKKFKKAISH